MGEGHSPATRHYGLGVDQVLSARVVLASGQVVTASPCENADLFYAIRGGGGGGTYGVVTQLQVKTYPTRSVEVIDMVMASAGDESAPLFLDAVTAVYSGLPKLSKAGFGGYGTWVTYAPSGVLGTNNTNFYSQTFTLLGETASTARELFSPFVDALRSFNETGSAIDITITQSSYADYGSYYTAKPGTAGPVGAVSALASRLLDSDALAGNQTRLREVMDTFAGVPGNPVYHTVVHHGLQAANMTRCNGRADAPGCEHAPAVQPGWYDSIILDIYELGMDGFHVSANLDTFTGLR